MRLTVLGGPATYEDEGRDGWGCCCMRDIGPLDQAEEEEVVVVGGQRNG